MRKDKSINRYLLMSVVKTDITEIGITRLEFGTQIGSTGFLVYREECMAG